MAQKPNIIGDVVSPKSGKSTWNAFRGAEVRLNLMGGGRRFRPQVVRWLTRGIAAVGALFLILGSVNAPTIAPTRAAGDNATSTGDPNAERAQLEQQLKDLEAQMNQYEGQIATYQKQGKTLSGQIGQLNAQIAKVNVQIEATQLTIKQLDREISDTTTKIGITQGEIADKKAALMQLIQGLYATDRVSLFQRFLSNPHLSDLWVDSQNITLAQDNLRVNVIQVTDLMGRLQDQQQEYAASRADQASAQAYQQSQAQQIASAKQEKNQLLTATKGQESKYQQLLQVTKATAAQIRDRIFQLLGGGQLSFEDAYQYAKLASGATSVPPELILAVLDRESALGQNVGRCSYKTAMSPSNIPTFLQITQELGLNPNSMMVSCPNADGVYGGAMGPAQFVPSTWNLYADGVSRITGHNPPSPWNNADAFAATGLYLKDAMAGCRAAYGTLVAQERCTAAKYYAGSRWKNYLWTYGEAVVERAQGFADDIATIGN